MIDSSLDIFFQIIHSLHYGTRDMMTDVRNKQTRTALASSEKYEFICTRTVLNMLDRYRKYGTSNVPRVWEA